MSKTIMAGIHGEKYDNLVYALVNRRTFKTGGSLRGEKWERPGVTRWDLGKLPNEWMNRFMIDHLAGIDYVVWSYGTPIAWVLKTGEIVKPDVKYSLTTTKHQGVCWYLSQKEVPSYLHPKNVD